MIILNTISMIVWYIHTSAVTSFILVSQFVDFVFDQIGEEIQVNKKDIFVENKDHFWWKIALYCCSSIRQKCSPHWNGMSKYLCRNVSILSIKRAAGQSYEEVNLNSPQVKLRMYYDITFVRPSVCPWATSCPPNILKCFWATVMVLGRKIGDTH